VITLEMVGEFLGLDTAVGLWTYFRRHWGAWFPRRGARTTFAQQAAHLWPVKQRLHQHLLKELGAASDPFRLVDGCPLPVCVLTRMSRCRLFPEIADLGYCAAKGQYDYGLHGHLLITLNGVITACTVTSATGDEREALWELTEDFQGMVIGDKGYLSSGLQAELATLGIQLQTPTAGEYARFSPRLGCPATHTHPPPRGNRHRSTDRAVPFRENLGAGCLALDPSHHSKNLSPHLGSVHQPANRSLKPPACEPDRLKVEHRVLKLFCKPDET
jgi:hypothetical protein